MKKFLPKFKDKKDVFLIEENNKSQRNYEKKFKKINNNLNNPIKRNIRGNSNTKRKSKNSIESIAT